MKRYILSFLLMAPLAALHAADAPGTGDKPLPERCSSKVVVKGGRPRLEINGQPAVENFFVTDAIGSSLDVLPDVAKAGYQVAGIPFHVAKAPRSRGIGPVWAGNRQYDWRSLDERFARVRSLAPGIKVILYLALDAPVSWLKSHPAEVVAYEDGTPEIDDSSSITSMAGASLASEVYLQDVEHLLAEMIAHIDQQPYRDMFMGIHLVGGGDGQWMHWGIKRGKTSDYSAPMRKYFGDFLRQKYRNDPRLLNEAWGQPALAFDTAAIPSVQRRLGAGDFRDPSKEQDVIDFTEAFARVQVDLIRRLAHAVKAASKGRAWVSLYTGSSILDATCYSQNQGCLLQEALLKCPDIDGLTAVTYYQRPLNQPGALALIDGSCRVHGKLAIHEQDIRTYLATLPHDRAAPLHGYTPDWEHQRNMLIREFGRVLTSGIATWQFDMHGGWYSAPEFWNLFSKFHELRAVEARPFSSTAEVAVVVDDISQVYRPQDDRMLQYCSLTLQRTPLGWMGAPYEVYLLADLLKDSTPKYKCYLFLNTYRVDSKRREQIHQRLRQNGAMAVWVYAPGIYCDGTFSTDNIEKLTGFGIARIPTPSPLAVLRGSDHPIVKGLGTVKYGIPGPSGQVNPPAFNGGVFYSPKEQDGVTVLATLESAKAPALAVRKMDGWTSIYSANPLLTAGLLRNIFRQSGGFLYVDDAKTSVCASRNVLSLFAKTTGERTLRLPQDAELQDMLTGERLGTGHEFTLHLKESEARLFRVAHPESKK
ncbi:MAG: hypothetical protein HZA88_16740 [Verrucomicrobia bacterium]|nr:hypothetical protein [Verrucomicrobiota bacterium]